MSNQPNRHKARRIERFRNVDQSKLDAIVAELVECTSRLRAQKHHLSHLEDLIRSECRAAEGRSDRFRSSGEWIAHLQTLVDAARTRLAEIEQEHDTMQKKVVEQKTSVKGWETLSRQLKTQVETQIQNDESLDASDRFLSRRHATG